MASGGFDGDIRLWEVSKRGAKPRLLKGHTAPVRRLVFSRDGSTLFSASGDRAVKIWDLAYDRQRGTLVAPHRAYVIAFSPDERVLAVGSAGRPTIKLWRAATEQEVLRTNW